MLASPGRPLIEVDMEAVQESFHIHLRILQEDAWFYMDTNCHYLNISRHTLYRRLDG